jgi:TIR domain
MNPVTAGKVFISHATEDKPLAEALSDLIEAGIGLTHDQIFCTSLAGQGIPAGTDFKQHIQGELAHSVVVIALLTPNYYASAFCLCELGGTWVLSKDFLPFVTPLAGFGDLKAVLKGVQALRIDQDTDLDEMRDRLLAFAASPAPTPRWSVKKDKFLKALAAILASLPKPKTPSASDLKKVTDERDGYLAEAKSLESELATLKLKYDELGKRKDKAAVKEVDLQFSGESEQFEILERSTKQALKPLSKAVEEALFYRARGETWYPGQEWDGRLDDDVQRELLKRSSDGYIYVNEGHPKIRPAVEALSKMEAFVGKVSPEFCEAYEEEYEDELSFTAKGFWERHV